MLFGSGFLLFMVWLVYNHIEKKMERDRRSLDEMQERIEELEQELVDKLHYDELTYDSVGEDHNYCGEDSDDDNVDENYHDDESERDVKRVV